MPTEILASRYRLLADSEFAGYTSLYERLARAMAEDPDALALVAPLGDSNMVPIHLFACIHDIVLAEPDLELARIYRSATADHGTAEDPWPAFRELLFERIEDITRSLDTRSIQTNEVGRTTALIPALTEVQSRCGGRPLSIVELGPSAGLNLLADRYRVDYSDGRSAGPSDAALTLGCDLLGPGSPPLPSEHRPLDIVGRVGIDLAPIDVTDPIACRWLEACVWPDVPGRPGRLRSAIEIARRDPPSLLRGDALELLVPAIDALATTSVAVVVSTWVLAYFSKADRLAVHQLLGEVASRRDVALVTAEYPTVTPWVPEPPRPPAIEQGKGATLLGLAMWEGGVETDLPLAWMHAHGLWLDWMEHV